MTKKKHKAREELKKAADELVNEMWEGRWDHIKDLETRPLSELIELFEELEKRCPGHSHTEYQEAFARSYITNR